MEITSQTKEQICKEFNVVEVTKEDFYTKLKNMHRDIMPSITRRYWQGWFRNAKYFSEWRNVSTKKLFGVSLNTNDGTIYLIVSN